MIAAFVQGFTGLVLVLSGYMWWQSTYGEMVGVKSQIDGQVYLVRKAPDQQLAADLIARIRGRILRLIDVLETLKDGQDGFCRGNIEQLRRRFRPDRLSESPSTAEYTSYSVNKGEQIFFCMRSKSTGELQDENTLTFVALHEVAHVMTRSVGHTDEFWNNFRFLLRVAIQHGIYSYQDFRKKPVPYCGIEITDSPFHPELHAIPDKGAANASQSCR